MNQSGVGVSSLVLTEQALQALRQAAQVQTDEQTTQIEERNVWQPNSWLIQRCWEMLADQGANLEALQVARLLEARQPLAPLQALYRIASRPGRPTRPAVPAYQELQRWQEQLFQPPNETPAAPEQLLYLAAAAALLQDETLALACLERLDQIPKAWSRLLAHPDQREQLATAIAYTTPSTLSMILVTGAIRRFDDAGAQLLYAITTRLHQANAAGYQTAAQQQLLAQCIETIRHATLVQLQSRRIAAMILGQAGQVDELLNQVATIQSVLSAQRATGNSSQTQDSHLIRQVKRTSADRDVDFLVYALCNAIEVMPLRTLPREQRIALADQVAAWGALSDGWTAASAAGTLIDLGAIKYAVAVVDQIQPKDPARSEGMLTLVKGLLRMDEPQLAAEEAERALAWAQQQEGRTAERALTWGLAEIYLQHRQPELALRFLERWREPTGWQHRVRTFWRNQWDDDALRNNSLRFRAFLQLHYQHPPNAPSTPAATARAKEIRTLFAQLQKWAPRLLEGEALIHFYVDNLLQPLLAVALFPQVSEVLPALQNALSTTSGSKHAVRVTEIATLLAEQLQLERASPEESTTTGEATEHPLRPAMDTFLTTLWQQSAQRGLWQTVHSVEGTLPLLQAREGSAALVQIAHAMTTPTTQ
ncbi:MAG: hypothetical protein KF832_20980 [Caldilineaceae bacterium]|nr:hypothetical protein [Caldilineaceae bacterium]